ncbi:hypothetical protein [Streptococcus pneumoniae]|uniref:hypothetical protein n=1 Tax=Streptococcus pneumoniae TaxID=1313 RepID=UPI000B58D164|nr:hypothetical protein [Streptococcus pneumoniae]
MKIKEQARKLAVGCSKHVFEVAISKHVFEVAIELRSQLKTCEVVDETDEVSNHIYGKATLTKFELDFRRV